MTILTSIKNQMIILKTLTESKGAVAEENVGIIDVDYSLIRYLGKHLVLREVALNNCGYPIIRRNDNTITTLHRFILEYYSQYDNRLKQILLNNEFEINHKNKDKLDNRLGNLEIVTHQNNIRHSKGLEYETIITSEQLQEIQQNNLKGKQQAIDKAYLNRINGLFYKSMKNSNVDEKILKCCYFKFKYNKISKGISKAKDKHINALRQF